MREQGAAKPLLTKPEAAERLGVSLNTIYRLCRDGKLQTMRIGNRLVRIHADSLDNYINDKGGAK